MKRILGTLAIVLCFAMTTHGEDPAVDATVQLRHGLRMKLVPPPAPKPPTDSDDPLADITNKMTDIVGDLADLKTDQPVQDKQKQVVSQLDEIIAMIEKQKSKSGNGGGSNPTKPLQDSIIASGPGGVGELRDPRSGTHNINNLPARQREAILQSKTEGFPPGYESLLQSYYQRLAQEKVGDEPSDSKPAGVTPPATRPAP